MQDNICMNAVAQNFNKILARKLKEYAKYAKPQAQKLYNISS